MIPDFKNRLSRRSVLALSSLLLPVPAGADEPLWRGLADLEKQSGARIGVAAMDTGTGRMLAWRETERFVMCSSFKLSLAAATLARADKGAEKLDRLVRYDKSVPFGVSPATARNVDRGMIISDLCEAAVIYSDNGAANLLLAAMGGPAGLTQFWRSIGDETTRLDDNEPNLNVPNGDHNTTSPLAMMANMKSYLFGDVLSAKSKALLLGWMHANTTGAARLRAGVPAAWKVGDKTGTSAAQYALASDIGILTPPGRKPILAAVYAEHGGDKEIAAAAKIIAAVFAYTSAASRLMSAFSSFDTGQPALALAASSRNVALSVPGIFARNVRCTLVMAKPSACFSRVTSAWVFISSAVMPASPRISDRAMVKQPAWAAPISSSGLVPGLPSKRLAKP